MGKAETQRDLSVPENVSRASLAYLRSLTRKRTGRDIKTVPIFPRTPSFYGGPANGSCATMFDHASDAARVKDAQEHGLPITTVKIP